MNNEKTEKQRLNEFYLFLEHVFGSAVAGLNLLYVDSAKMFDGYLELNVICEHEEYKDDIMSVCIRIPRKYAESKGFTALKQTV